MAGEREEKPEIGGGGKEQLAEEAEGKLAVDVEGEQKILEAGERPSYGFVGRPRNDVAADHC